MDSAAATTTVHVIAHTHWDREWYEPFQSFRLRLVDTVDDLLALLEAEPGLRFLLDGQTAMVDDYLAVRPERERDVVRLAAEGRLTLGPLTTLFDELLPSGETLLRNLRRGLRRAGELGDPLEVAYLPDMFGHTAQMPQILALAGLDRAVVWRGVPSDVDRTAFRWRSPDGSETLTAYLAASYSNAVALPLDPDALALRAEALVDEQSDLVPAGHVLAMCGTDHWPAQAGLPAAIARAEGAAAAHGLNLGLSSLPEYFDGLCSEVDTATLPVVTGEMRSGARANVLMGVTSTRVDLKRLQACAERELERYAEPLCLVSGATAPAALADLAWSHLVLNSAHDSVCSCSSDETMTAVEARYLEAVEIAGGLADRGLRTLAGRVSDERLGAGEHSILVWNPSPFPRSELLALEVPVHWDTTAPEPRPAVLQAPDGSLQAGVPLEWQSEVMVDTTLTGDQVMGYLPLLRSREFGDVFVNHVDFDASDDVVEVVLRAEPRMQGHLDVEQLKAAVVDLVDENPGRSFHVQLVRLPTQRVLVRTPEVPALGWTTLRAVPGAPGVEGSGVAWTAGEAPTLTSDSVEVAFAPDGTFAMADRATGTSVEGLGRLCDGGDAGDTYNWSPPAVDTLVDVPVSVTIQPVEAAEAPLPRRSVRVERRYLVPASLASGERARADTHVALDVAMTVTVTQGERVVEVDLEFDNTALDHRLRLHVPLPAPVAASRAGCAFGSVTRGLHAEGGPQEPALATYPAHGFVDCTGAGAGAGLTLLCDQVVEYEVLDGVELAITLVRSTGFLSRPAPSMRPNAAGPILAVRHAQATGPHRLRFGVLVHEGGDRQGATAVESERFTHPLRTRVVRANPTGDLGPTGAPVLLTAPSAVALTAFGSTVESRPEMRFVNMSDQGCRIRVEPQQWFAAQAGADANPRVVDLRGRSIRETTADGVDLAPWQIATLEW